MALKHVGYVELPPHRQGGGFDHAAVHRRTGQVYVAHTANDAVDVIDMTTQRYVASIPGLTGVAGALVSDQHDLVFTSNRGENTVGILRPAHPAAVAKVSVGIRPNGLAYDPGRRRLLAANGQLVEVHADSGAILRQADIGGVPDVIFFNPALRRLYVAIGAPGVIEVFDTERLRRSETVATEKGAHTLAFDPASNTVYAFLPDTHRAAVYIDRD